MNFEQVLKGAVVFQFSTRAQQYSGKLEHLDDQVWHISMSFWQGRNDIDLSFLLSIVSYCNDK